MSQTVTWITHNGQPRLLITLTGHPPIIITPAEAGDLECELREQLLTYQRIEDGERPAG